MDSAWIVGAMARAVVFVQDAAAEGASKAAAETTPENVDAGEALEAAMKGDLTVLQKLTDHLIAWLATKGPAVLGALALLIAGWMLAGWLRRIVVKGLTKAKMDVTLAKFFGNIVRWTLVIFVLLTCAGTVGVNTTGFAALIAASGLAIGLALQGNLGNLASGVLLMVFRPFKVGDAVIVAGQAGVVDGIDLFTTYLDTSDNRRIIVPNGAVFGGVIENQTRHPRRVASVTVPVNGAADLDKVRAVLLEAAESVVKGTPGALSDPGPGVSIAEIAPNLTWNVSVHANTANFGAVRQALLWAVKRAVDREGLAPPPQAMVMHVASMPK